MTYKNYSLKQLQQIDAADHLHPFTDHKELRESGARIITRADGPFIYDSEGNELLDGMAGLWCVNIGYGQESVVEAAVEQMRKLPYATGYFGFGSEPAIRLAERLVELAPGVTEDEVREKTEPALLDMTS